MAEERKNLSGGVVALIIAVVVVVVGAAIWVGTSSKKRATNPTAGMTADQAQQKMQEMMKQHGKGNMMTPGKTN